MHLRNDVRTIIYNRQRGQLNRLGSSLRSQLENATALGSRIPPHAVFMQVNDNTPVKLYSLFKNGVHLRNDVRTIIAERISARLIIRDLFS